MAENKKNSVMLQASNSFLQEIQTFATDNQLQFDEYQKQCASNGIRTITNMLLTTKYDWNNFTRDNIIEVLQQTAFLGVNPSATPHECYYMIRNTKVNDNYVPVLEFGIEGAGNDTILRKFGQDVLDLKSYIVYEGDKFVPGYIDGWDVVLPKYTRMFISNKPLMVVYLIKKINGEIDVQYADTQDVKKSLLANAKQNGATDQQLRELNKLDLYEILENEKWINTTITKKYQKNGQWKEYETPLFNPSYTSPISMYNMIERKLRNHATRKYPKNFNVKEISRLYENTFDEKYNEKGELITAEEQVQIAHKEVEEQSASKPFFEKNEKDDRPAFDVKEEPTEETKENIQKFVEEQKQFMEKAVEVPQGTLFEHPEKETKATDYEPHQEQETEKEDTPQPTTQDKNVPDWL